ncbi:hypothetical protein CBR_g38264 [Chara braunii]|uniref:DDE Tnp4 domain-containing protein n=1 Tax=Chara braunii TaxID=69332 RepID=A0A388LPR7_CHABU|nr:hypothetical protein CBR_g38264 [Chara braunii]|eukprot:GBG84294.1 hypothetical protein CBR_g38264 [Chara braunii]
METATVETAAAETGAVVTGAMKTTAVETATVDTAPVESGAVKTAAVDTSAVETTTLDTAAVETALLNTAAVDTAGVETAAVETAVAADEQAGAGREHLESGAVKTAAVDTSAVETTTLDTAAVETALLNTAAVDTAGVETAAVETAVAADEQAGAGREHHYEGNFLWQSNERVRLATDIPEELLLLYFKVCNKDEVVSPRKMNRLRDMYRSESRGSKSVSRPGTPGSVNKDAAFVVPSRPRSAPRPRMKTGDVALFDTRQKTTRGVVERAFGRLKRMWRLFLRHDKTNMNNLPQRFTAVCIIHNLLLEVRVAFGDHLLLDRDRDGNTVPIDLSLQDLPHPVSQASATKAALALRDALHMHMR